MTDLELTIERRWFKHTYCIGRLSVEGIELCDTLEDKDRELTKEMGSAKVYLKKVYGSTAIPTGRYEVKLSVSPKFKTRSWAARYGGLVPEVLDVPGFSGIRLHPGSNCSETYGCPLVGENRVVGGLVHSQQAFFDLMDYYLMPAHQAGQKIYLTIKKR